MKHVRRSFFRAVVLPAALIALTAPITVILPMNYLTKWIHRNDEMGFRDVVNKISDDDVREKLKTSVVRKEDGLEILGGSVLKRMIFDEMLIPFGPQTPIGKSFFSGTVEYAFPVISKGEIAILTYELKQYHGKMSDTSIKIESLAEYKKKTGFESEKIASLFSDPKYKTYPLKKTPSTTLFSKFFQQPKYGLTCMSKTENM